MYLLIWESVYKLIFRRLKLNIMDNQFPGCLVWLILHKKGSIPAILSIRDDVKIVHIFKLFLNKTKGLCNFRFLDYCRNLLCKTGRINYWKRFNWCLNYSWNGWSQGLPIRRSRWSSIYWFERYDKIEERIDIYDFFLIKFHCQSTYLFSK